MKTGNAKAAAIYCRISRDQEGEGIGVERQETACRELAQRLGLDVVMVAVDNDTGASDQTRKSKVRHQYRAMLDEVRQGRVRFIISYSNSRLTRRIMELEDLIQLHEKTGVQIHTVVSGNDDLSTADGQMVARIKASVDAAEAKRISERMKAALRHQAQSGKPRVTSRRPFGWMPDGKTLDPFEAEVIRKGVRDLINGVSLNHIRKQWMEQGIKTPSGGTEWHWTNVQQILTSWRAVGIRTYNREVVLDEQGQPVRGQWEAIVTEEEREQALTQLAARARTRKRSGKYLLSGLLRCECGKPMWGNKQATKGRKDTYFCSGGGHVAIDAERLEFHVLAELYAHLANRALRGHTAEQPAERKEWAGQGRLTAVLTQIDQLMAAFNASQLSGEVVFPQIAKLEQERDDLRQQRVEFYAEDAQPARQVENAEDVIAFVKDVDGMTWPEKQAVLRQETETIVVQKGVRGVASRSKEVFAKRVNIVWKPKA